MEPHQSAGITNPLSHEVARRRTFAIISHPDAGKTTLTEKLLLYAGAVDLAGAVRARKTQHQVTSDWMALEQERGISVTVSALEMDYLGYRINLLDTPGHQDFSEDTYRTLMAVDSAVMVLDSAKGIEPQTLKLFHACRLRRLPILTFVNKLDRPGRDPLELLDEIEQVLGMAAAPMNWPIGSGPTFQGVYEFQSRRVLRFQRTEHGQRKAPVTVTDLHDPALAALIGDDLCHDLREQTELLIGAGTVFDRERFCAGELTPVFFGSALTNFGVASFFEALLALAPPPQPRLAGAGMIAPTNEAFSGFVFKIQANMNLRHRDRMAFLRVCSGRFYKDIMVYHPRRHQNVRLSRAYRLFARERETITEAFPGDVIGISNPGLFAIGDTLSAGQRWCFEAIPRFEPEHFATLHNVDIAKHKQFAKGVAQLEEEGAIQVLFASASPRREPLLAAVGELQFDVVVARLREEYGVSTRIERLPFAHARWIEAEAAAIEHMTWPTQGVLRCRDREGQVVALFASPWVMAYCQEKNPAIRFMEMTGTSIEPKES
jgi:peptide chain release factor 3